VKRRELELIAAKNQLLPRLDAVGRYRWLGAGDILLDSQRSGIPPFLDDSSAFESLTSGDFQEWELGLQFSMPLGMRRGMAAVKHHQLLLARERVVLKEVELEVSHQLAQAQRDIDLNYGVAQTNFNRRAAAEDEVRAVTAIYEVGRVTLDLLLDAQRRRAEAESAFYRSLVDYNRAIMLMHFRKGSLLEYNGVYLAEGPWPGKAYFDAMRRARQRDASLYLNYGFTRPNVIGRGPAPQAAGTATGGAYEGPVGGPAAPIPLKQPEPIEPLPQEVIPPPSTGEPVSAATVGEVTTASYAAPVMSAGGPTTPVNPFPRNGEVVTSAALIGLPTPTPVVNPFGPPQPLPDATYTETTPLSLPVVDQSQANHAPVEAARDAPGGAGGQR
jgi:hypothetical protein